MKGETDLGQSLTIQVIGQAPFHRGSYLAYTNVQFQEISRRGISPLRVLDEGT
jgi:hypothetical protein